MDPKVYQEVLALRRIAKADCDDIPDIGQPQIKNKDLYQVLKEASRNYPAAKKGKNRRHKSRNNISVDDTSSVITYSNNSTSTG